MKNLLIITVLFVLGFVSSCKKDETTTPTKTKKEIITAKTWIVGEVISSNISVYKRENKPADNLYDLSKVVLKFNVDGSLTGVDNNGKAVPSAKWSLSTDESKITISNTGINGLDGDLPIVQVTDPIFEVKGKVTLTTPIAGTFDGNIKLVPQ
jgi:hypothetical protein